MSSESSAADLYAERFHQLPLIAQRALTARIAGRRGRELRRLHPDVEAVLTGNRSRADEVTTEPCLIFLVKTKKPKAKLATSAVIPRSVRAYAEIDGQRRLIHVPTDVLEVAAIAGATPDAAPTPVEVLIPGERVLDGQICCIVRIPEIKESRIAISCRHVLTSSRDLQADKFSAALVYLVNDAADSPHVVEGTSRGGHIVDGIKDKGPFSFDAQLASVNSKALDRLRAAMTDFDLAADWPKDAGEVAVHKVFVQTRRGPLAAKLLLIGRSPEHIEYGNIKGFHEELIILEPEAGDRTRPGDSGAPVTERPDGGRLIGMHIASSEKEPQITYAIPVWQLLRPLNYRGGSNKERWELVPASELGEPFVMPAPRFATAQPNLSPPTIPAGGPTDAYRDAFAAFAIAAATELAGLAPVNPSIAAAQCILESGWGTSSAATKDNAYFGIKATGKFAGKSAKHQTTEDFGAGPKTITDSFRTYDSWWHSFLDYGDLIRSAERYARARNTVVNALEYLKEIKLAGYATDPNYVDKVRKIVNDRPNILKGPI